MEKHKPQNLLLTLACAVAHLGCMYVLFLYFLALTPDSDYLGLLTAYVHKARSLFYQFHGFRALVVVGVAVTGALTVRGLLQILENRDLTSKVLGWVSPGLFVYAVVLALGYVVRPNYIEPGESHVTMLSLLLTEGKPIYSPEDNADLANTWYGPVLFLVNAVFLFMIPDPILATKLRGLVGLVVGLAVFYKLGQKHFGKPIAQAGLVHVVLSMFVALYFAVGNRADSLILCLTLCASGALMLKKDRTAMVVAAACIAGAVNSKVTAVAYMLPLAAYMVTSRGWKFTLRTTALSIGLCLLPFLIVPLFPLHHYWSYVSLATSNQFEAALLWENIGIGLFLVLPLLFLVAVSFREGRVPGGGRPGILYAGSTLAGVAMICLTASKEGSGFYHLLGFVPGTGLLFMDMLSRCVGAVASSQVRSRAAVLTYGWLASCLLLTLGGQLQMAYGFKLIGQPHPGQEVHQILADYPGHRIAMGYGEHDDYSDTRTFYRPLLFKTTKDNPMNTVSMLELFCAEEEIPETALVRFEDGTYDVFLIPRGGEPFTNSFFTGLGVTEAFIRVYERVEVREYFEIWKYKGRQESVRGVSQRDPVKNAG